MTRVKSTSSSWRGAEQAGASRDRVWKLNWWKSGILGLLLLLLVAVVAVLVATASPVLVVSCCCGTTGSPTRPLVMGGRPESRGDGPGAGDIGGALD